SSSKYRREKSPSTSRRTPTGSTRSGPSGRGDRPSPSDGYLESDRPSPGPASERGDGSRGTAPRTYGRGRAPRIEQRPECSRWSRPQRASAPTSSLVSPRMRSKSPDIAGVERPGRKGAWGTDARRAAAPAVE